MYGNIGLILIFLLCVSSVSADDGYQYESSIERLSISDNSSQSTNTRLSLEVYRAPVQNGNYPYAESRFFDRHSSVSVYGAYNYRDFSSDNITSNVYLLGVEYSENNFPATLSFFYASIDASGRINALEIDGEQNIKGVSIGAFLIRSIYVSVSFIQTLNETVYNGTPYYEDAEKIYEAELQHIAAFSNNQYFKLTLAASKKSANDKDLLFSETEKYNTYEASVNAKYYFSKSFAIGVGFMEEKIRNVSRDGGRELSISLSKFYSPKTSLDFSLFEFKADHGDDDNDYEGLSFGLIHRF